MTGRLPAVAPTPCGSAIAAAADPAILAEIGAAACTLAIWHRPDDAGMSATLATLPHDGIDDIAATLDVADAATAIARLLRGAGYSAAAIPRLAGDVARLVAQFGAIGGCDRVALRLEWVETDACRRFHADYVGLRLLTTYLGRGTQWKRAADADATAAEMLPGAVGIFKGRRLAPEAPILHRSPPIGGTGERRLLLVLDQAAQGGA